MSGGGVRRWCWLLFDGDAQMLEPALPPLSDISRDFLTLRNHRLLEEADEL